MSEKVLKAEKPTKEKGVPFGKLLAWAMRNGSTGIAFMIFGYLTVFCVNTMKMDAKLVGALLLVSKLVDGVTDLFAGYIVDKTNTRWGKGRPYEWCVVGMWVSTVLMFMVPAGATMAVKAVWVLCMYLFANSVFYTFLNANNTVYMVRAFKTQKEYVQLSTYGGVIPMIMTVVFNIAFPMMMKGMATTQSGWIKLVLIFAVPLTVLGMLRFFVIKETNDVDVESKNQKVEFREILELLRKNPYIYIVALGSFAMNIITNMGVNVFYFTDIVGNVGMMSVLAATQIITLPLMFIFPQFLKKISPMKLVRCGLICAMTGYAINFFAGSNMIMLIIGNILTGAGVAPTSMMAGLLTIECADYNEYIGLHRLEGSLSAVTGFAKKIGAGLGSGLLGILIGLAGYDGNLTVQPDSALTMIRMLYSLIPLVMYLAVYLVDRMYKLDKHIGDIRKTNEENRAKAQSSQAE